MGYTCLSALIAAVLFFNAASGNRTHVLKVTKRLENGDILPMDKWSTFTLHCPESGNLKLEVETPFTKSNIKFYLANEDKNLLELNIFRFTVIGYKYESPYGEKNKADDLEGEIDYSPEKLSLTFNRSSIPINVTRISASIHVKNDIYNYYGIFNIPIGFDDTMVIEEFKKVTLCDNAATGSMESVQNHLHTG